MQLPKEAKVFRVVLYSYIVCLRDFCGKHFANVNWQKKFCNIGPRETSPIFSSLLYTSKKLNTHRIAQKDFSEIGNIKLFTDAINPEL
jgi:hypothetical protein